jgi:Ca2+-binding EF-hand superfamily protein
MGPKHVSHGQGALDFESKVDEIAKLLRNFVELKSGFGEDHVKSRTLQNILKQFDVDHQGNLDCEEFARTLDYMNVTCSADERIALFNRYDKDGNGRLQFKEIADAMFGIAAAPLGNPEARSVVKKVTDMLKARVGDNGVRGLSRMFSIMDKNRDQEVSREELFNGLQRYGLHVTLADVDVIIKHFDRDGTGYANLTEFQRALRGHMSTRRVNLVRDAYGILDQNGDQSVTLQELASVYSVDRHPAVVKGTKTADEVMQEFASGWDKDGDSSISWAEFVDYYRDISAGIDSEDYFELMMRNCWHMSGGTGNSANTSCRRVLVTFKDGRQLIEEIKNDLGIGAKDVDKMKAALEKQGLRDIVKIEAYA